jgi:hypothetical protein
VSVASITKLKKQLLDSALKYVWFKKPN